MPSVNRAITPLTTGMPKAVPATPEAIAKAAQILRAGGLVCFATETVYGLGADATCEAAVARIYAAKGRPHANPLITHVANLEQAERLGHLNSTAKALAQRFWPGPLTLVVPLKSDAGLARQVTAGLPTVALRVPRHQTAQALLKAAQRPLAAPSANISGRVSATTTGHALTDFGDSVEMILDSGPCEAGIESTIVDASQMPPRLLRPGAIPREALEAVCGPISVLPEPEHVVAPGMLKSHYAPRAKLRLNAGGPAPGEAFLAFGPGAPAAPLSLNLSPRGDLGEAAANLFAYLRQLDASGAPCIAVMRVPESGLGEAINDRLRRAAAPRDGG